MANSMNGYGMNGSRYLKHGFQPKGQTLNEGHVPKGGKGGTNGSKPTPPRGGSAQQGR